MKILGLKLTHDGSVAVLEDGLLTFATEMEKVGNAPRYTKMPSIRDALALLDREGHPLVSFDSVVIDGWKGGQARTAIGETYPVAGYHEFDGAGDRELMERKTFHNPAARTLSDYASFTHMAGHIIGGYVASPFAGETVHVLSWDGGQQPRLHRVSPSEQKFIAAGPAFYGILYALMGLFFGPYRDDAVRKLGAADDIGEFMKTRPAYDIPGKLMSYIAKGNVSLALLRALHEINEELAAIHFQLHGTALTYNQDWRYEHSLLTACDVVRPSGAMDADVLATLHQFQSDALQRFVASHVPPGSPLIFVGGSALNIKWNSALRSAGYHVWVPPFPNDAGSAIGAAACEAAFHGEWKMSWNVYAGAKVDASVAPLTEGWRSGKCSIEGLANRLWRNPREAIVVLHGRAEIGPRALGHRSIFASATEEGNKALLNAAKGREDFRPVAPICLEEYAPGIFDPGTRDPFMLFDHAVRAAWSRKIPAVVHLDGTARLQTVGADGSPFVRELLTAYGAKTGVPLLCNTSANFNGKGFFPDVRSAQQWCEGKDVRHVWSEGTLYERMK